MARDFTFAQFLEELAASPQYAGEIVHVEVIPPREASFGQLSRPLPEPLARALARVGVSRLYRHQAEAVEGIRNGEHTTVVTSTASGKTLCYNLPVLESLLAEPGPRDAARALYLFPTKALAQDQLRALNRLAGEDEALRAVVRAGTYDGDTPGPTRRRLRAEANILLTNPEMLHQGILPYHSRWAHYFANLRYVVVDEVHVYRGIFGSNVANVLRRLRRVCQHYGSAPTFVCCSATIANPKELAERLTGLPMRVVDRDGSPRGPRRFVFWNPPYVEDGCGCEECRRRLASGRRHVSGNEAAQELLCALVERGVQTIAFCRTRTVAELLYRYSQERLRSRNPKLAERVRAYRAGYLPEERREIERLLFSGELLGVTSTNALELGIDVGSLDAALIVSYPGTIASTWQQAGRAGRGAEEALVVLIAYNDPLDQYLMRCPEFLFGRSPEHGVVDPENPYLLRRHLRCAAFELPLREEDTALFGPGMWAVARELDDQGDLKEIDRVWYWSRSDFPAAEVNLRNISDATYAIMDLARNNEVIGTVDSISAPELVYPGGVYLHDGETYLVRRLDLEARAAYVERAAVDYYTQAVLDASIRAGTHLERREWRDSVVGLSLATVSWRTAGFKKIKFYTQENIGYSQLDLPAQRLETKACWLTPGAEARQALARKGLREIEGLVGIRNVAVNMLPLVAMCDRTDVGGIVDSSNFGVPTMFLYDRYPGGLGFSEKGYQLFETLMEHCLATIERCPCHTGCPACVGLPANQPGQHMDPDLGHGYRVPDKEAAWLLLCHLLGRV